MSGLVILIFLLIRTKLRLYAEPSSTFSDLVTIKPCGDKELCLNRTDYNSLLNCQCDRTCPLHGDCCRDSPFFRIEDTQSAKSVCKAVSSEEEYVHVWQSCPDSWQESFVREACQKSQPEDPLLNDVPITDVSTMLTYRNAFCAKCNNANLSTLRIWQAELECLSSGRIPRNTTNIVWDPTRRKWMISENGKKYSCGITAVVPPGLGDLRSCFSKNFIRECPPELTNSTLDNMCRSYTAYVMHKQRVYQNIYCFLCNVKDENKTSCKGLKGHPVYNERASFRLLLDFEFGGNSRSGTTARGCTKSHEVYDPFFKKCREILNVDIGSKELVNISRERAEKDRPLTQLSKQEKCKMIELNENEFELSRDNNSVMVKGKTYYKGDFRLRDGGKVAVCVFQSEDVSAPSNSLFMVVVTYVGLGTSTIFLILHLCAVALVSELRNLSGKTLASLCVALLFAYVSFITGGGLLEKEDKPFCTIAAVMIYYFFLAAFSWMLVLGFDVWRALIRAVHFQHCRGGQWRRFLAYSAFSWLTPGVLTIVTLYMDNVPVGSIDERFRPEFGLERCWFSRKSAMALAAFFGVPLSVTMFLNVGFFVSAAWMAMGTRPGDSRPGEIKARRDFRLYLRLAIMVGLTWLVGFLANVWDHPALWFTFVLLNTLQGLFIFILFTCTAKVRRSLTKRYPWAQSGKYTLSRESKKSNTTKSSSLTRTSDDALPASSSGSSSDNAQEKSSFLRNAFRSYTLNSQEKRKPNIL